LRHFFRNFGQIFRVIDRKIGLPRAFFTKFEKN
jgi:hypothetical protein